MSFFVNTMVCGFSLYQILAFFLIYSCLGWCLEVIYAAVSTGQLVNRGFLNGPVCPIYGFGMIIVLFTLSPLADNLLLLYLGGVILPSVLELVGGWALYKLYHTRWWDYSDFPFNIGGYICLEFSLLWGVGTVVVMKAVHPVIAGFVEMVPQMVGFVLMCILYACYAADVVVTAFAASDLARELDALEKVADSMHAVSDAMTELLGTTAMDVDQKMDESRLQLKLAAAEARDNAAKLSPRDAAAALRAKADEAMEAARKSSQEARLNASEAAVVASSSQRSLSSWPAWPLTQMNSTLCLLFAVSRRSHRSRFLTGCLLAVFQPRFFHPSIQCLLKALTTYCESEWTSTSQGRLSASSATMTAMSSMRLLVVLA